MILRNETVVVQRKDFRVCLFSFQSPGTFALSPREILTGDILSSDIQSGNIRVILF